MRATCAPWSAAVIEAEKEWVRARFAGLVDDLGCADPEGLAVQLLAQLRAVEKGA